MELTPTMHGAMIRVTFPPNRGNNDDLTTPLTLPLLVIVSPTHVYQFAPYYVPVYLTQLWDNKRKPSDDFVLRRHRWPPFLVIYLLS